MKVKLGTLRRYLLEAVSMTNTTTPSAPTDPDATVPGHLPNELPQSAALDDDVSEQAMVPGRWYGGEEPVGNDRERLGDQNGMDETDDRMEDDGLGNGVRDPNDPDYDYQIADHLRGDEEKTSLGDAPDETMEESLNADIRRYLMQEDPAAASVSADPTDVHGFYTAFDMNKDHTGTDDLSATWYRSPGRTAGEDGDPFRGADPYSQLGFHPPAAQNDPVASPPAVDGEEGAKSRLAPPIWQLSAGSDTSKVLGAGAKADSGEVGSEGEPEETEEAPAGGFEPPTEGKEPR